MQTCAEIIAIIIGAVLLIIGLKDFLKPMPTIKCILLILGSVIAIIGFKSLSG